MTDIEIDQSFNMILEIGLDLIRSQDDKFVVDALALQKLLALGKPVFGFQDSNSWVFDTEELKDDEMRSMDTHKGIVINIKPVMRGEIAAIGHLRHALKRIIEDRKTLMKSHQSTCHCVYCIGVHALSATSEFDNDHST